MDRKPTYEELEQRVKELDKQAAEHKRIEEELQRDKKRSEQYLDIAEIGLVIIASNENITQINKKGCEILKYNQGELIGKNWFDVLVPSSIRKEVRGVFSQLMAGNVEPVEFYENPLLTKDGEERLIAFHNTVIRDQADQIVGALLSAEDITERKRAEAESKRLMQAIEQATEAIVITDIEGTIQYINPAFRRITGYTRDEAKGQNPRILKSGKQDDAFYRNMWNTLSRGDSWHGRLVNKKKDGTLYTEEAVISPVLDTSGQPVNYVAVKHDVTKSIKLEEELRQAQKMEAIGSLAGGVAHDFNNVLYAIIGYTELAMDAVPEGSKARRNLQEVLKAADRAKDMVQQILSFSRKSEKEKKPINVQSVLKEAMNLIRTSLPSTIEIRQDIDADCGPVMADLTQIHETIMNLCTNAYHAMREKGGVLGITLVQEEIGPGDSKYDLHLQPGPYLKLIVEDTGHGIDGNIMEKIFDPYFTTKGVGEGTGMGLSVVYGIVRDHGGDIRVYSEPGKGTAFHVYLPVIETGTVEREIISAEPAPTGTERILFVDDEEQIVNMTRQMLEGLGYHVTPRTSSLEALEAFRARPDDFDLVITDMTMPNMTGAELAPKLLEIRSDIPILLCTGFSELMDENKSKAIGIREYVMKPIVRDKIAGTIRKVLDDEIDD